MAWPWRTKRRVTRSRSRLGEMDGLEPPADLLTEYERADLLTNLVVLLARRPE